MRASHSTGATILFGLLHLFFISVLDGAFRPRPMAAFGDLAKEVVANQCFSPLRPPKLLPGSVLCERFNPARST